MRETLTRERLLELLEFDETISRFRWKKRPGDTRFSAHFGGKLAGCGLRHGLRTYRHIMLDGKLYLEHRLFWLVHHGHFPIENIDHKDGDGLNNAKENLRLAPGNFNHKSMAKASNNTSGYTGVCWHKETKKWEVKVQHNGTTYHGGLFKEEDLLLAAAKAKEMREAFGFSPTHGLTREERQNPTDQPIVTGDDSERASVFPE